MTSMASPTEKESPDGWRYLQDLLVPVLLVVAALATSWSSYQATRWNGEQAVAASRTSAIWIEAARAQGLAQAQTQVDLATFSRGPMRTAVGTARLGTSTSSGSRDEFRAGI